MTTVAALLPFWKLFENNCFLIHSPLFSVLSGLFALVLSLPPLPCVQMEDSPSPKRQRLSQQSMLDLNSAPPSTPSSPIRPWELPPSRRPHPHYMPERCHTPLRNRRRCVWQELIHINIWKVLNLKSYYLINFTIWTLQTIVEQRVIIRSRCNGASN